MEKIEINKNFKFLNNLRGHTFKYCKEIARLPSRKHFFFNRISNSWIMLPNEVITA